MVREVWEETGVLVEVERISGTYNGPGLKIVYSNGDQAAVHSTVFECRPIGGQPRPDGVESLAVEYFSPQEIGGAFLEKRWHRRISDALAESDKTSFDPPTWRPPD